MVLVVIGVVMGGVSIAVGGGGPEEELRGSVQKFTAFAEHASEMAVLTGKPFGLMLEPPGWQEDSLDAGWRYRWQTMELQGWVDYPELQAIHLPKQIALYVTIEGELWDWEDAPEVRLPVIAFYPGGDMTIFEIEFTLEGLELDMDVDATEHVAVDDWGRVVWVEMAKLEEELRLELEN